MTEKKLSPLRRKDIETGRKLERDDLAREIIVDLAMTALANEDASSDWMDGFEYACKRVKAVLGETE